jgi:hypothetical protein
MKNLAKLVDIIAFVVIIGLAMTACDNGNDKGGNSGELSSVVLAVSGYTSQPPEIVAPNTELEAFCVKLSGGTYTGTVSYQWNRNGTAVPNAAGKKYAPNVEGDYTVTVTAEGRTVTSYPSMPVAPPFSNFIGTWRNEEFQGVTLTISSISLVQYNDSDNTLTWTLTASKNEPWLNRSNYVTEYPSGWILTGSRTDSDVEQEIGFSINAQKNKIYATGSIYNRQQ